MATLIYASQAFTAPTAGHYTVSASNTTYFPAHNQMKEMQLIEATLENTMEHMVRFLNHIGFTVSNTRSSQTYIGLYFSWNSNIRV